MSDPADEPRANDADDRGGFSTRSVRLAWILALVYALVVVYVSLQPFQVWRIPPPEVLHFLTAPWPRYITLEDIAVNLAAYLPLGFLLSVVCVARLGAARGALAATVCAAALSLSMESLQMFQPSRIASNVDLLTNALGALTGAMSAPLFAATRPMGSRLHAWRHRAFHDGMVADTGFVIVCLWVLAQMNPVTQLFGTGAVRGMFDLPVYFAHTPQRVLSTEALVVLLNLVGLGLILGALTRPAARGLFVVTAVIAAGAALKTAAAVLAAAAHPLLWLTPGVGFGLVGGALTLYALTILPARGRLVAAIACIIAATTAINLAPDNPYQNIPARLISGGVSHYLSFSGIVRGLSELWPVLAVGYLVYAMTRGSRNGVD